MAIEGRCDAPLDALRGVAAEIAAQDSDGFALAVEVDGLPVVDLWAGRVEETSLIHTFSTVKPIAACALLIAIEQGKVELNTTLGSVWPELNTSVASSTVAHALGHRCGLVEVPNGDIEGLLDWSATIDAMAQSEPNWVPGSAHGEHAFTYGHLVGELLRRVDGRSPGRFIRDEITDRHGIDVHIGMGPNELDRVVDIRTEFDFWSSISRDSPEAIAALGTGIDAGVVNSHRWRTGEVPAVNGHASARGLARFWSLALDGTLPANMLEAAGTGLDLVIGSDTTWTLGSAQLDDDDIGMGGLGGSYAGARPGRGVTWAFLPVAMGDFSRADAIDDAITAALS